MAKALVSEYPSTVYMYLQTLVAFFLFGQAAQLVEPGSEGAES